jgi:PII-like signaling protein
MFGNSFGDWASPYEYGDDGVGVQHTTGYFDTTRPDKAIKGATVYKGAKGASVYKGIKGATVYKGIKGATVYKGAKGASVYKGATVYAGEHPQAKAIHQERLRRAAPTAGFQYHSGLLPALARAKAAGLRGFGDIDVPYTTSHGATGTAHMTGAQNCGDMFGVQQALNDLGYPCAVDGIFGPETSGAMASFAQEHGLTYTRGTLPDALFCQQLENAWTQRQGGGGGQEPAPSPTPSPEPTPGTSTPVASSSALDRLSTWWSAASTTTKVAVVGGAGLAAVLVVMALKSPPKRAHA